MSVVFDEQQAPVNPDLDVIPALWQTVSVEALAVLQDLRSYPLTQRQERILRTISAKYYKRGYCFARHETIAAAVGCAKSTVQIDLDELEARALLAVRRRPGTSNVTILAPGMIEALRTQRVERRRADFIARSGISTVLDHVLVYQKIATTAVAELAVRAREVVADASAAFNKAVQPKAQTSERSTEKNVQDFDFSLNRPKAVLQPRISTSNYICNKATSDDATKRKTAVDKLCVAGVSQKQARELIRFFGAERAERNLALGLHFKARNPGGFLSTAIRENYAATHVLPGSEAAAAREQEDRRTSTCQVLNTVSSPKVARTTSPLPKHDLEIAAERFEKLSLDERSTYEEQAKSIIAAKPPSWIQDFIRKSGFDHPAVRGSIKTKSIELWRISTHLV